VSQNGLFDYKFYVTNSAGSLYGILSILLENLAKGGTQDTLTKDMGIVFIELEQFREKIISDLMARLTDESYKELLNSRLSDLYSLSNKINILAEAILQKGDIQNKELLQPIDGIRQIVSFIENSYNLINNNEDSLRPTVL
jgi:hypothetical protein